MPRWWLDEDRWQKGAAAAEPALHAFADQLQELCAAAEDPRVRRHLTKRAAQWVCGTIAWITGLILGIVLGCWVVPRDANPSQRAPGALPVGPPG